MFYLQVGVVQGHRVRNILYLRVRWWSRFRWSCKLYLFNFSGTAGHGNIFFDIFLGWSSSEALPISPPSRSSGMFVFECRVSGSGIFRSGGRWAWSVLLLVWWDYENAYNSIFLISTIFGFEQDIFGSRWILYRRISSLLEHNKVRRQATIRGIAGRYEPLARLGRSVVCSGSWSRCWWCADRWSSSSVYRFIAKWHGFSGGIEINLVFVWVVEIHLISV